MSTRRSFLQVSMMAVALAAGSALSLSAGVDLKRRVVEELRPTLLDNMGLFAAVRWQFSNGDWA